MSAYKVRGHAGGLTKGGAGREGGLSSQLHESAYKVRGHAGGLTCTNGGRGGGGVSALSFMSEPTR